MSNPFRNWTPRQRHQITKNRIAAAQAEAEIDKWAAKYEADQKKYEDQTDCDNRRSDEQPPEHKEN
jgi:hypothetical protein